MVCVGVLRRSMLQSGACVGIGVERVEGVEVGEVCTLLRMCCSSRHGMCSDLRRAQGLHRQCRLALHTMHGQHKGSGEAVCRLCAGGEAVHRQWRGGAWGNL